MQCQCACVRLTSSVQSTRSARQQCSARRWARRGDLCSARLQQFIKVVKHHGDFAASIFIYAPQAALQRRWSRVRYLVNYLTQLRRMNANHSLVTLLGFMEVRACVPALVSVPPHRRPAGTKQQYIVGSASVAVQLAVAAAALARLSCCSGLWARNV